MAKDFTFQLKQLSKKKSGWEKNEILFQITSAQYQKTFLIGLKES